MELLTCQQESPTTDSVHFICLSFCSFLSEYEAVIGSRISIHYWRLVYPKTAYAQFMLSRGLNLKMMWKHYFGCRHGRKKKNLPFHCQCSPHQGDWATVVTVCFLYFAPQKPFLLLFSLFLMYEKGQEATNAFPLRLNSHGLLCRLRKRCSV